MVGSKKPFKERLAWILAAIFAFAAAVSPLANGGTFSIVDVAIGGALGYVFGWTIGSLIARTRNFGAKS